MNALTDRYVHATLNGVPESRRSDLGEELRSTITDMVDGRVAAGEDPQAAEYATLAELGDPSRLAAEYADQPLHLIGPRYYLVWKKLLNVLLAWVPAIVAAVVAVASVIDTGQVHSVGEVVVEAGAAAFGTAVHIIFWTTLVFAVLERTTQEEIEVWSPDLLPDAPTDRGYSFADAALGIAFNVLVAAALVFQQFRTWVVGTDGEDIPVLEPGLWSLWLPFLLVVILAGVVIELWKYARGWTPGAVIATVVTSIAFAAPVTWLALEQRLLNPEFLDAVGLGATGQDRLALAIAVGAIGVALWEIGEALVKWTNSRRKDR